MFRLPPEFEFLQGKLLSSRVYPEFFSLGGSERVLNAGFGDGPQALVYADGYAQMTGVEYQADRAARARRLLEAVGLSARVEIVQGNVEAMPVKDGSFDVALAIDIIEHVEHPEIFLRELYRVLAPGGRLLITFPAMHDRFQDTMAVLGKWLKPWKHREPEPKEWHPDHHQHEYPVAVWQRMTEAAGFRTLRRRATTMFPPLHLYGIPRFWFRNSFIHAIDRWIASVSFLQRFGQTVMVECIKPTSPENLYYITNIRFPTEKAHGLQIAKMCEAFRALGQQVTLVIPDRKTPIQESPEQYYGLKQPFPIVRLPSRDAFAVTWMPRLLAFFVTEWSFCRAVKRWMMTLPDKTAGMITRDQFLVSALRRPGWKLLFEAHDIPKTFFWLHRRLAKWVDVFVTTNNWKREALIRQWGMQAQRVFCLPNGIDTAPYEALPSKERARQELGWDQHKTYVVYTGHLYDWKGVYVLAKAAAFLPPTAEIVMVGGTTEDALRMKTFITEQQLSRVSLVSHVPPAQVLVYLAAADVLVLPNSGLSWNSRFTTSPIKLWEYLAARRPVVVSELPSLRELVSEKEVFFAPPDDPEALARALMLAARGVEDRVLAGWQLVQRHSWQARATDVLRALGETPASL